MNNREKIKLEDLNSWLIDNELTNYDPVAEAFKIYDPDESGFINTEVLRSIFSQLGFGRITNEDLAILVETADCDGDGKVSLEDFRNMLDQSELLSGDTELSLLETTQCEDDDN
eukprot:56624_1